MCGIGGWIGHVDDGPRVATAIARRLHHRGPDGAGHRCWSGAALAHTRLSIIDLSEAASQPIANENGAIQVSFNGEIYNHRALRADLESRGHVFRSYTDSEVLPHLYEEYDWRFAEHLRGMFAIAVYVPAERRLLLARDRFGIKPLFFAPFKDGLAFASELGALREVPGVDLTPDRQSVFDFAALSYIPAPRTFFRGVHSLEPGEVLDARLTASGVVTQRRRYHSWTLAPDRSLREVDAVQRVGGLLNAAVGSQLESDVPLGALLSGGIDSSLVSEAAQAQTTAPLQTFNVQFPDPEYDETWAARAVADHIHSHHTTLPLPGRGGEWDEIASVLAQPGQPYGDTSIFAAAAVCRLMRERVTVALSGDGGDEAFGGYDFFGQLERIARWQDVPMAARRSAADLAHLTSGLHPKIRWAAAKLSQLNAQDDVGIVQHLFCWVREEEHRALCLDVGLEPVRRWFEPRWSHEFVSGADRLERLSALATEVITRLTLANDFLVKVDSASMRVGLEVRVPMLDEDLFAFGLTLPHRLKTRRGVGKQVLRRIAEQRLPSAVAHKKKWGFGIPVDRWVTDAFRAQLRDALLGPGSTLDEFFRRETFAPMVEAFCDGRQLADVGRQGLYQRVMMLFAVHLAMAAKPVPAVCAS